jgi:superfamily I DNA and/or RNA helicase/very-short-patch-repair endonuclease
MNNLFSKSLNELREKLIDTSRRNKLINYKRPSKSKNLKIIDESPEFIYNFLIKQEKSFNFKHIPEPEISKKDIEKIDIEINNLKEKLKYSNINEKIDYLNLEIQNLEDMKIKFQKIASMTAEERAKELGYDISKELPNVNLNSPLIEEKYIDDSLQTLHYPNEMEKILTYIYRNSKSIIEETGSNMLYLMIGMLKWNESKNSEIFNSSPLICIPVILEKEKKYNKNKFTLQYTGEGIETNKSLAKKLYNDFNIILPELTEEINYHNYLKEVYKVIKHQKDWSLKDEIAIDVLTFGKIIMYQDLDEKNWENLSKKKILKDILEGKEVSEASIYAKEYDIDKNVLANKIPLVMNADSSQHSAIVDVLNGKNVVIEGPPGTGKSQTISNLIAALLAKGKSVLFVSEKLAALEVVYKRLESIGLSDFCLELHSHKSKKTKVLESIKKRIESKYKNTENIETIIEQIEIKKKELKTYIDLLHEPYGVIKKKVYNIFWLVDRYNKASKYLKFNIPNANEYNSYKLSTTIELLKKYQIFLREYDFNDFYWKGLEIYTLNFVDIESFIIIFKSLQNYFKELEKQYKLLNINIKNEYTESKKIYSFIEKFNKIDNKYSKEILFNLSQNSNFYDDYLSNIKNVKNIILTLKSDIEFFSKYREIFEQIIIQIVKINKTLKHIKNEANISNNKNIEYINQLCKGIQYLSYINEDLYSSINSNYLDTSFSKEIDNLKKDLYDYNQLKDKLSLIASIKKVDKITIEKIQSIEKIIYEKKDSFFNFFSKEYKESKKLLESILIDQLPKDKSKWDDIIGKIKKYISYKINFENNDNYIQYFGKLFNGVKTNIEDIEKLYNFALVIKKDINISEILNLLVSGNISKYNLLISYKDSLVKNLESYNNLLDKIEKISNKKFIKKLYYDRDDVDIIELKDKLEAINGNIDYLIESFYKADNLNQNSILEEELFKLITSDELEDIFATVKRNDIGINNFILNFEEFINLSQKINSSIKNIDIELSDELYEQIVKTKEVYEFIFSSNLELNLKQYLTRNIENINILESIATIQKNIEKIYHEMESKASIKDEFFGENIKISDCIKKIKKINENQQTLSIWINFRQITHDLNNQGLTQITTAIENGQLPIEEIINNFKYNFYNTLLKEIFRKNELFNKFNRLSHEESRKAFRELDQKLIKLNREKVAYLASQRDIPYGYRGSRVSDLSEYSLVEHEIKKKKRHIPIRQLVARASGAIQALKTCFMMSPLSVSQYLPPNQVEFDVLIVDEASQLKPEEALGAIARVNQIVIVGDPKQLPPTSFFDSVNKTEDEETVASENESILDICLSLYKPIRQLRWHYRSQHESLIDFSNKQFYENNLIVFPSPSSKNSDELGLKYHYIENSAYQNGRNKVEAKIIIEHLEKQMKNYPNRSIGIGTFNSTQRDLIQDMVDEREKESPVISTYIDKWSKTSEPFFIKNLENLQGDERDVILISTTFGKDKDTRRVYQRFGPINSDTGWRRLNVMFTRAKQKMEIFTSMKNSDIILSENSSRGVRALKAFLNYLEKGVVSEAPEITNKDFDSDFEISVYNILKEYGFDAAPQVGVAGYFIDLAVKSTKNPNDFVLAIECDGATYHSSKSARDRDRLKQDVLEKLGWHIYRIWSVDWYKNRENEISKLIKVVKEAQAEYNEKIQSIPIKESKVVKAEYINKNIKESIEEKKEKYHHTEKTVSKSKYKQLFLTDEEIKEKLIKFRENIIAKEFKIDKRCILSDLMITQFIKYKPLNIDEFHKIPIRYRNDRIINVEQMKYLNDIFDILELSE